MKEQGNNSTLRMLIMISLIMAMLVVAGTMWMGHNAREANDEAVRAVSVFFLDELAGRREQVVSMNLKNTINDMETAISLLSEEDLEDESHLSEFQAQMKKLYNLEMFAFINDKGTIYTAKGKRCDLEKFHFDVLFSGDDWKGSDRYRRTEEQFKELGASIEYFPYTKGISTTQIKEQMKES